MGYLESGRFGGLAQGCQRKRYFASWRWAQPEQEQKTAGTTLGLSSSAGEVEANVVASRVESGDQCKAAATAVPQVIGNIQTAIGCGTLTRANGVAVQVVVGDPVCQGDVIETAADGPIGIRFIDGTVFNLSHSARAVLNEFVCDSNGTPHSALFGVTKGTFAFIAGQVAKNGSLTVDTPVGSIRGRAHAGGFGMLSLAALTFSMMKEVQAADPNATFLDDDSIEYKDLEHGTFELVTKEAIPRHIIVEDPGETIVLNKIGSSVSVNQVANSADANGGVTGGPAGRARQLRERAGAKRIEHPFFLRSAASATHQFY